MELPSQRAELLQILYDVGLEHFTEADFKTGKSLAWYQSPPAFVSTMWKEVQRRVQTSTAIEDTATGYFFAAKFNKPEKVWNTTFAPYKGNPGVTTSNVQHSELAPVFRQWAERLKLELEAFNLPWGKKFRAGETPLTLGKIDNLRGVLEECGFELESIRLTTNVSGSPLTIRLPEGTAHADRYYFVFQPRWAWNFAPAEFTENDASDSSTWGDLLAAVREWSKYLRREGSVIFPRPARRDPVRRPSWKLLSLSLSNIRRFADLKIDFDSGVNLICGPNGTGKSTLLRCLAIGLAQKSQALVMLGSTPGGLLSANEDKGELVIVADTGHGQIELHTVIGRAGDDETISHHWEEEHEAVEAPFVCGYGSGFNLLGRSEANHYSIAQATQTLFNYRIDLFDLETVLSRLKRVTTVDDETYLEILKDLRRTIGLPDSAQIRLGERGVEIFEGGLLYNYDGLADGYRSSVAWFIDMLGWAILGDALVGTKPQGVLLIDEVDKHLHPAAQADLIPRIRSSLPGMQMVMTTHNPLTVLGSDPRCVFTLGRTELETVTVERAPDFRVYTIEDMYVDPRLFDAERYSPDLRALMDEQERIGAIPRELRTKDDAARLAEIVGKLEAWLG